MDSGRFNRGRGFKDFDRKKPRPNKIEAPVPIKSEEGWILFVTNLHEEITEDEVKEAFADYGEIINLHLNLNRRTGFVKGYAMIEFKTKQEADNAREAMNNSELLGVKIRVEWCFVQNPNN